VPRLARFGEAINDHQLMLARALAQSGQASVVIDQSELLPAILAALSAPPPPAKRADRKLVETIAADLRDLAAARHLLI